MLQLSGQTIRKESSLLWIVVTVETRAVAVNTHIQYLSQPDDINVFWKLSERWVGVIVSYKKNNKSHSFMMLFFLLCRKISIDSLYCHITIPWDILCLFSSFLLFCLLFFPSLLPTHPHCSLDIFDYLKPSLAAFQTGFNIYQASSFCLDLRHESIHGWLCAAVETSFCN